MCVRQLLSIAIASVAFPLFAPGVLIAEHNISFASDDTTPVPVLFDTDICGDVDDVLALAMLHALADRGECDILAVTVSRPHRLGPVMVDAINTFYGRPSIPIALTRLAPDRDSNYLDLVTRQDGGEFRYPHDLIDGRATPSAVELMRRTLADSPRNGIKIVQVGLATNTAALLRSPADDISPLSGEALIRDKVAELHVMAGAFEPIDGEPNYREANVRNHVEPMAFLATHWPRNVPIIWSGFEVGRALPYPRGSIRDDFSIREHHIVREAYLRHSGPDHDRPTWDLTSVLEAVRPNRGYFERSQPGTVSVDAAGATRFTATSPNTGKTNKDSPPPRDRILVVPQGGTPRIIEAMRTLVSQPPQRSID